MKIIVNHPATGDDTEARPSCRGPRSYCRQPVIPTGPAALFTVTGSPGAATSVVAFFFYTSCGYLFLCSLLPLDANLIFTDCYNKDLTRAHTHQRALRARARLSFYFSARLILVTLFCF